MSSAPLGQRFWALWAAFTGSNLGDGLSLVAFPLLAISLTDDARLVALVTVFRFLPFLVVGLPAGVLIDRSDRRAIAILGQIGRGAAVGLMAVVIIADAANIGLLAVTAFVVGVGEVLVDGGLPALVRDAVRVDQLEVANSRMMATQTVSNTFVGPPLGALLFEIHPSAPFISSVVLYLGAVVMLGRLPGNFKPTQSEEASSEGIWQQMMVGLRYVWSHPVLRPLALAVAAFSFVGQAGNAVFVILITERFGLSGIEFGVLIAIDGVAAVIMSFFVARVVAKTSHTISMRFAIVTYVAAALLFGLTTAIATAVLASLISGVSDPSWNVISSTIRQRLVPDEVFGRMMTAYLFIAWSANPLGAITGGMIAEQWGAQWVYVMGATVVGSLLVFGRPLFRAIDEAMAAEPAG